MGITVGSRPSRGKGREEEEEEEATTVPSVTEEEEEEGHKEEGLHFEAGVEE